MSGRHLARAAAARAARLPAIGVSSRSRVTSSALVLVLCVLAVPQAEAQDDPRLTRSRELAAQLQQALGGRLLAAIESGGPVEAIEVCTVEASPIAGRLSEQSGARVGRTALRLRNPLNAPDAGARTVLEAFQRDLAAGSATPPEYFQAGPDGSARYMSPIVTQPLCLACHGAEIAPEVAAAIAEHYPADQATGFALGDLRGAFIIDWPEPAAPGR